MLVAVGLGLPLTALSGNARSPSIVNTPWWRAERSGSGTDVVLVCGLGVSARVWDSTVAQLKGQHRVHVLQLRGAADIGPPAVAAGSVLSSAADDLAAYLTGLPGKAAVIAHSGGGVIALTALLEGSKGFGKLMLVDAVPAPGRLRAPRAATAEEIRDRAYKLHAQTMQASPGHRAALLQSDAVSAVTDPTMGHRIAQWYVASDRALLAQATLELALTDLRPQLPRLAIPITVVHADQASHGAPPGWMGALYRAQYAAAGDKVRFVEIANSRHFAMLDQPQAFADAIRESVSRGS
jgi:pimeloyl-ACP methyl ester carboxylesterase